MTESDLANLLFEVSDALTEHKRGGARAIEKRNQLLVHLDKLKSVSALDENEQAAMRVLEYVGKVLETPHDPKPSGR